MTINNKDKSKVTDASEISDADLDFIDGGNSEKYTAKGKTAADIKNIEEDKSNWLFEGCYKTENHVVKKG